MGSFSPYIWFTQTAVVPKHLFCTYLLAAFPLKAGKYFFLTISFSSLSVHVGKMDLFITGYSSDAFWLVFFLSTAHRMSDMLCSEKV